MHAESTRGSRVLIVFLTVNVLLTGMAFAWLGWDTYHSYYQRRAKREGDFHLEVLRGVINHLDEVLTMSARMSAATGHPRWEERYRQFEPELDSAIEEAVRLARLASRDAAATETDAANVRLVEMENDAFALVHQGRLEEAQTILYSAEYEEQKQTYARGMKKVSDYLQASAMASLQSEHDRSIQYLVSVSAVIATLLFAWIASVRAVNRYIAERKRAEEVLREVHEELEVRVQKRTASLEESEARTRAIVDTAADGIITIDRKGTIQSFNGAAEQIFGYSESEAIGENVSFLMPSPYREEHDTYLRRYLDTGVKNVLDGRREMIGRRKDGSTFPMDLCASEARAGDCRLFTGIVRDITGQKKAEEDLWRSRHELEQANAGLTESMQELEQFNALAVGRELRMIALKEEVNSLLSEQGESAKYEIVKDEVPA